MPDLQNIIKILTNDQTGDMTPQTPDQIKAQQDYAYNLLTPHKLQGNAVYGGWNALADSIRGLYGGQLARKGYGQTKEGLDQGAEAVTRGVFPGFQPQTKPPSDITTGALSPKQAPGAPSGTNQAQFIPKNDLDKMIQTVAAQHGIDPAQLKSYVDIESGGKANAKTGSYKGLLQLSDSEFKKYADKGWDIFNPEHNLMAGARKLKAEGETFKNKYGRDASATDIYLTHQQGEGGYHNHITNPKEKAWVNMLNTGEGKQKGERWAKQAIWGNIPETMKRRFGSVDNVTSEAFINLWDERVARGMQKGLGVDKPTIAQTAPAPGQDQIPEPVLSLLGQQQTPPQGKAPPLPGQMNLGGPQNQQEGALGITPQQAGQQIVQAGQQNRSTVGAEAPYETMQPMPPAQQQAPPMAAPPMGQQPQKAPGAPQIQPTQNIIDLPTNQTKLMQPEDLQKIMRNQFIDPAMKGKFLDKAMTQGEMQAIDVDGGKLYFNPSTGQQQFIPKGEWGKSKVGQVEVDTYRIKDKGYDKPPSIYYKIPNMGMVDQSGKPAPPDISKLGGPEGASKSLFGSGVDQLLEESNRQTAQTKDVEGLAQARNDLRKEHIKIGQDASKLGQTVKLMRELENAKESENIDTGPWAPTWLSLKKTINDLMPGTFKEGPITVSEMFNGISNVLGSQTTRSTDPNPTMIQFQKIIEATPGILQTPNGRRAMISVLEHGIKRDKEIGDAAIRSKTIEDYLDRVDEIKKKYDDPNNKVIPDEFLKNVGGEKRTVPEGQRTKVNSKEEFMKLPKGTPVTFPDGSTGTR